MKHDQENPTSAGGLPGPVIARGDLACRRVEETEVYQELQKTYARLDALAREGAYGELAEEVARTNGLIEELRQSTSTVEPGGRPVATRPGGGGELEAHRSETERAVTEILQRQKDLLEILGTAAQESRAVVAYLARARGAVERYHSLRSIGPRLRSCWA